MPRAAARRLIELPPAAPAKGFDDLVDELARRGVVVVDAERLRTPEFVPALGGSETDKLLGVLAEAGAAPPPLAELGRTFDAALIRGLVRSGQLVAVSPELVYPPASLERIRGLVLDQVAASGPFTVAQFRDLVGASRKWVVPLLEYLDRTGYTVRQGDVRILGPKAKR